MIQERKQQKSHRVQRQQSQSKKTLDVGASTLKLQLKICPTKSYDINLTRCDQAQMHGKRLLK